MEIKNSLGRALIKNLRLLKDKRDAMTDDPEYTSQVMIPIPYYLIKNGDHVVKCFLMCAGKINRNESFGLPISLEKGEHQVKLNNGEMTTIVECVATFSDKTDIDAVERFLIEQLQN